MTETPSPTPAKRLPFQPLELDALDRRLEAKGAEKGIPTLTAPPKAPKRAKPPAPKELATPRARMKALNVELPDYVWIDLKKRAATEMVAVRHVIMSMLSAQGIHINEVDMMEDGRRLRGRQTPKQAEADAAPAEAPADA